MPLEPEAPKTAADYKTQIEALDAKLKKMEERGLIDTKRYEDQAAKLDALQLKYDELVKKAAPAPSPAATPAEEEEEEEDDDVEDLEDEEEDFLP